MFTPNPVEWLSQDVLEDTVAALKAVLRFQVDQKDSQHGRSGKEHIG